MIRVFSVFILLKGVNLNSERHSLLSSMLPGSKFCADAVYLENNSSWKGLRVPSTESPSILLLLRCPATAINSGSFQTNSRKLARRLPWLSFHKSNWAFLNFWQWALPQSNASPLTQDLFGSWGCLPPPLWTEWCSQTQGPWPCTWPSPKQPTPHCWDLLSPALFCHCPSSSQPIRLLLCLYTYRLGDCRGSGHCSPCLYQSKLFCQPSKFTEDDTHFSPLLPLSQHQHNVN